MGGFDLGFALAGLEIVAQVEIEPYCQNILEHYFPDAKRYGDIREVAGEQITRDCGTVELVCGGFPCQDISSAGKGAGLDAARSGLWWEMHRLIGELRPRWVVVENVLALRTRGLDRVLAALGALGYKIEPWGIPAKTVGASHERKRIWLVAYLPGERCGARGTKSKRLQRKSSTAGSGPSLANTNSVTGSACSVERGGSVVEAAKVCAEPGSNSQLVNTDSNGMEEGLISRNDEEKIATVSDSSQLSDTDSNGIREQPGRSQWADWSYSPFNFPAGPRQQQYDWEEPRTIESKMGVTVDGIPRKLALRAIGNAVVPAIPYAIARTIQRVERALASKSF